MPAAVDFVPGTRIYSDGLTKDHRQSLLSWVIAVFTLSVYTGWIHFLLALVIASCISRSCLYVLIALWSTRWLPAQPLLWSTFCRSRIFQTWREYFRYSFLNEAPLDASKTYIFVEFPHGVFPLSPIIAGTNCQAMWPEFKIYSLAASSVYTIPWWRHFIAWMGAVPATTANFKRVLKMGSVAVIVGGIAEMYMQHPHKERIKLLGRKGFVKVAIEQGISGGIIPVYHFGNTQVFDFWPQAASGLARKYQAGLGFLVGRWLTPVPRQVPLFQVSGAPIPVPHIDPAAEPKAFERAVDEVHAAVVQALQQLYDKHKEEYGWQHRPLIIE